MNQERRNDAWRIMKSGQIIFDRSHTDIMCIICEKVLINAHFGPCGCRYCLECIVEYLIEEKKFCPGKKDYCKHELLCINQNVHSDQPTNRKIMEIIVKCPHPSCDFEAELINIKDHIRICTAQSRECLYSNMGCKECNLVNVDELRKHMLTEIVSHTKLLFDFMDNLKNEIKVSKEDKVELDKNNTNLMTYISDLKLKYENENKEIKEILNETINKCDEEKKNGVELRKEIKRLNEEIVTLKKDTFEIKKCANKSQLECDRNNKEIKESKDLLKKSEEERKEDAIGMKQEIRMLNEEMETLKKETLENKEHVDIGGGLGVGIGGGVDVHKLYVDIGEGFSGGIGGGFDCKGGEKKDDKGKSSGFGASANIGINLPEIHLGFGGSKKKEFSLFGKKK